MSTKVAINGLGRIGRAILKLVIDEPSLELVAVNDLTDVENLAYLVRFDSVYGRYSKSVVVDGADLVVAGRKVRALNNRDPLHLPWKEMGVEVELITTAANLTMTVENRNTHRTPLRPHDKVDLKATVTGEDGTIYAIRATQPMVSDPQGRFTTWSGVGFDVWLHGRSGIGAAALPPMNSSVAVFALGDVSANDTPIAAGVPVHVVTSSRDGARLELTVGDLAFPVADLPNGHLRAL